MANSAIASDGNESLDVPSLSNFEIKRPHRCACGRYFCIVLIALILLTALILGLVFGLGEYRRSLRPEVMTTCGLVRGKMSAGVFHFLGIPYALPPTGEHRFRPARDLYAAQTCKQLPHQWPREAKTYGPSCLQAHPVTAEVTGSEDCLYLNVFSLDNAPRSSPRPVIVVIGGLFFMFGGADSRGFKVTPELVKATGAVHVTFNYRLGALGFLAAKGIANLGLWDQISALRWVKMNIARFGGDPDNVMIFGYGSGATSAVSLAMAAPVATFNLFHKIWLSSPMLVIERTPAQTITEMQKSSGCKNPKCFANMTGPALSRLFAISSDLRKKWFELPYGRPIERGPGIVVLDNLLLRESPSKASDFRLANIPFVLGSTSNEVDVYLSPRGVRLWNQKDFLVYLNSTLRLTGSEMTSFRRLYPNKTFVEDIYTKAVTDLRVSCPLTCFGDRLRAAGVPRVYRYVLHGSNRHVDPYSFQLMINSSFHGWDALLYFSDGGLDAVAFGSPVADYSLRDRLRAAVSEFANSGRIPEFRPLPATNVLGLTETAVLTGYRKEQCGLWRSLNKNNCFAFAWAV